MAVKKAERATKREPDLRGKNPLYLWSFVAVNAALFLSVVINQGLPKSLQAIAQTWSQVSAKNGIIAVSIPIVVIILSGVLSETMKARLVFWRWQNPLPGCRAFSVLVGSDARIDVKILAAKHGKFPRNPTAQNGLWYKIYREHKTKSMIWASQQVYLLTRDLSAIAACLAILFSTAAAFELVNGKTWIEYTFFLMVQYGIIASAARNYGNSFVVNVLCEECATCGAV